MNRIAFLSALLLALLSAAPAAAQATRTWVSGVGDDANPCSRTAPCKTFAGAISKTAAGGEINTIDPGGFGAVTITKSITIDGGGGHTAGITAAGVNGVVVNAASTDVVQLRNLDLFGVGTGLNGVRFLAGAGLLVENVVIYGFTQKGISFEPSGAAKLFVANSTISNNLGASGGGILVQPGLGGSALVNLANVKLSRNQDGLRVKDRGRATVEDSTATGGGVGAIADCTTAACEINIERSTISNNQTGVATNGAVATVRLTGVGIINNTTGISAPTGSVISFGNNQIGGNATNGAPTSTVPQQ